MTSPPTRFPPSKAGAGHAAAATIPSSRGSAPGREGKFDVVVDSRLCKACGLCVDVCERGVFEMDGEGRPAVRVLAPERCVGCRRCVFACPELCVDVSRVDEREG
ncbi:MAG: hypothetical protein Kow0069_19460 [Promethearchaeota archaeon]